MSILFLFYSLFSIPKIILRRMEIAATAEAVSFDETYKHYPDWVPSYPKIAAGLSLRQRLAFSANIIAILYSAIPIIFLFTPHPDDFMGFQMDFFLLGLTWLPVALTTIILNALIVYPDRYVEFEQHAITSGASSLLLIWERRVMWVTWVIYTGLGITFLFVH